MSFQVSLLMLNWETFYWILSWSNRWTGFLLNFILIELLNCVFIDFYPDQTAELGFYWILQRRDHLEAVALVISVNVEDDRVARARSLVFCQDRPQRDLWELLCYLVSIPIWKCKKLRILILILAKNINQSIPHQVLLPGRPRPMSRMLGPSQWHGLERRSCDHEKSIIGWKEYCCCFNLKLVFPSLSLSLCLPPHTPLTDRHKGTVDNCRHSQGSLEPHIFPMHISYRRRPS